MHPTRILLLLLTSVLLFGCDRSSSPDSSSKGPESIAELEAKANTGDASAQFALGVRYDRGDGVATDYVRAAQWYAMAAKASHMGATKNLATLYYRGQGVPQDYRAAFSLFYKASEMGDVAALHSMASMYLDGFGVEKNQAEALRLFRQSAQRDYPFSHTALGLIYWYGWGVNKDPVEGVAWWIVAEPRDPFATENLAKSKGRLSEDEIARATARSEEIRKSIEKSVAASKSRTVIKSSK